VRRLITLAASIGMLVALALPGFSAARAPVVNEHDNFTSDPYPDGWCGIQGTSIDTVHDQYRQDASGAVIETMNISTVFTSTASKRSMTIQTTGAAKQSAPVDNGDGTFTILSSHSGLGPKFTFADGTHFLDRGTVGFATVVDANGEFISFDVLYEHGQHPPGCSTIIAELTP
jgi:hypothetical protein